MPTPSPNHGIPPRLDAPRLQQALNAAAVPWKDVTVVDSTGSTNTDLVAAVAAGRAGSGSVIAAGQQTQGRGRLGRVWQSPAGTTLSTSIMLTAPAHAVGFLPLLTGIALLRAIDALSDVGAQSPATTIKWPNDVLIAGQKVAGILAEAVPGGAVIGCGVNVSVPRDALPVPEATSLGLAGITVDRTDLLAGFLAQLFGVYRTWAEVGYNASAAGLVEVFRRRCSTLGREVRVQLPGEEELLGTARDIDDDGHLIVATAGGGDKVLTVGDVVHLR